MQAALHPIIGPSKEIHDLTGRTALVTGGTMGIGIEVAKAFAQEHAKIILVARKEEQGNAAIKTIKEAAPDAQVEFVACDLGNLAQVREVFDGIRKKEKRLDLLILSSGINSNQYAEDTDGIDRHFGVNWLGHYYAINRLYPLMRETSKIPDAPAPRIVFEASEMHKTAPSVVHFGSWSEINDKNLSPMELYGRSKLAMILGAKFGLYERVIKPNNDRIFAIAVHPGAVNTDMQDQWMDAYPGLTGRIMKSVSVALSRSPEQGSYSALYAATSPEIEDKGWNGEYLVDPGKLGSPTSQAKDEKLGSSLWNLSQQVIKEKLGPDSMNPWTV